MRAFSILWRSIVDFYGEMFPLVGMNILWVILSLPILALFSFTVLPLGSTIAQVSMELAFVPLMVFVVLAPNPASAGLHYYANQLVKEERVEFELFKEGLRRYWKRAFALTLISLGGFLLILGNIVFYVTRDVWLVQVIGFLFLYVLYLWTSMQLYVMPLLIEQEDKRIRLIYRNAALLAIDNVTASLILTILLLVIAALSVLIPLFVMLVTASLVALVQHRLTLTVLEKYRARSPGPA
ncbi:MAG: hypothetical protein HYY04_07175 [Chloroflexi bacterium]|nr:hypothetical protein [Chloroflexota bacterium]